MLLLAVVTLLSAHWPRYQAYRLHREVLKRPSYVERMS